MASCPPAPRPHIARPPRAPARRVRGREGPGRETARRAAALDPRSRAARIPAGECADAGARCIGAVQWQRHAGQRHESDGLQLQRRLQLVQPGAERPCRSGRRRGASRFRSPWSPRQHARRNLAGKLVASGRELAGHVPRDDLRDPQPVPLDGPIVTVTLPPPTPTPAPTPPPTPTPTPRPTAAPTPTLRPARRRDRASRRQAARRAHRARAAADITVRATMTIPTAAPSSSASPSGTGEVLSGTPGPKATPDENNAPAQSPEASDPAADDDPTAPRIPLLAPFLIVGGAMSFAGAAVLGRQWFVTRRRPGL